MRNNHKAEIAISFLMFAVIIAFAFAYNSFVTTTVTNKMFNDEEALTAYNNEIIQKLGNTQSTDNWQGIIDQYHDLVVVIEDSSNRVVTETQSRTSSALDVKVRTAFEYHGSAYLIISSVYLLRDYTVDSRDLIKFLFVEFLIGLSALAMLFFIIYTIIMRPYRKFYQAMEEYERTGTLTKQNFKGNVGRIYNRFVSLTKHLEKEQQNQQRIIASISHDIKTPLTSVLGYAERLQTGDLTPERTQRYLETIYGKAQEIRALMDEFDEYLSYRMMQEIQTVAVPTDKLEKCLLEEYTYDLELMNVKLEVNNLAPEDTVLIDRLRMTRVFGNLISNSIKHLSERPGLIVIDIFSDKDHIFVDVSDNGTGIDPDKMEVIFEPLYTSDQGRKVAGLGLAICREILESLGGSICAKPSTLGGLCICMTLQKGSADVPAPPEEIL